MATGELTRHASDAVVLATGGYGNVFFLSTNAQGCNVTALTAPTNVVPVWQIPVTLKFTRRAFPSTGTNNRSSHSFESLRNDGRIWTPKDAEVAAKIRKGETDPNSVAEDDRDYFLERKHPSFGNLAPRDISSRAAKEACDEGRGVANTGLGVFLDFRDAIKRDGQNTIKERYGNLFDMYQCITGDNPYETPMMIFPAVHYTMGGLWVDYNLESIPGMFVGGEANFSDHGANRLGASALMQGLSDGYFILPYTVGNYLGKLGVAAAGKVTTEHPAFAEAEANVKTRIDKLLSIGGNESPRSFHKRLGHIIWEQCGMARSKEGLEGAIKDLQALRKEF